MAKKVLTQIKLQAVGGAASPAPPVACSLIWVRTFLAMWVQFLGWWREARSDLLDLVEADLDGRLASED